MLLKYFLWNHRILSIYRFSEEVVKYDGKYILSNAACCDTCVLCSTMPTVE